MVGRFEAIAESTNSCGRFSIWKKRTARIAESAAGS
jgi:hypothetical protein